MTTADFRPTHVAPQGGMSAWEAPDVNRPTTPLDALLPVRLADRLGDWARIVCANGWSAWVDGRLLIAVPGDPPAAGHPLTRTADPGPLLARADEALSRYRRAAEDLSSGATDGETFRGRTRGLRVGMVVDGESMWLYDAEHERWVYCDGSGLSPYAADGTPSTLGKGAPAADGGDAVPDGEAARPAASADAAGVVRGGPEPTQVVETAPAADAGPGPAPAPRGADAHRARPAYAEAAGRGDVAYGGEGRGPSASSDGHGHGHGDGDGDSDGDSHSWGAVVHREVPDPGPNSDEPTRRIPPVTVDPRRADRGGDR